jgi:hypothetical protein
MCCAEGVRLPVQVQAGYAGERNALVELGVRLAGEHIHRLSRTSSRLRLRT